jgi:creatinine amidohydrolase
MDKFLLNEMTWKEAKEAFKKTDIAIISTGACHPHGSACPLGTDNITAEELSNRIGKKCMERGINLIILPNIPFGYNEYHGDFPGNISIDQSVLESYYINICKWLHKWGIKKIIWNCSHGGNISAISSVAYRCRNKFGLLSVLFSWYDQYIDLENKFSYADEGLVQEMSAILYLKPELCNISEENFSEYKQPFGDIFSLIDYTHIKFRNGKIRFFLNTKDVTDTGGWGPPESTDYSKASAKLGEHMIETVVTFIVDFIEKFKNIEVPNN